MTTMDCEFRNSDCPETGGSLRRPEFSISVPRFGALTHAREDGKEFARFLQQLAAFHGVVDVGFFAELKPILRQWNADDADAR
jgi:hypothetical protein